MPGLAMYWECSRFHPNRFTLSRIINKNDDVKPTRSEWNVIDYLSLPLYCCILNTKQVHLSSGTAVYQHMPILRPHAARFHERRISSVACGPRAHWTIERRSDVSLVLQVRLGSDSSDFGLLGRKVPQMCYLSLVLDADEQPCKIWLR